MIIRILACISCLLAFCNIASAHTQADCHVFGEFAAKVMEMRQSGYSIEQTRAIWLRSFVGTGADEPTLRYADDIIDTAYKAVIGKRISERQKFIDAMKDGVYRSCLSGR